MQSAERHFFIEVSYILTKTQLKMKVAIFFLIFIVSQVCCLPVLDIDPNDLFESSNSLNARTFERKGKYVYYI